jgi:hypothetical protein
LLAAFAYGVYTSEPEILVYGDDLYPVTQLLDIGDQLWVFQKAFYVGLLVIHNYVAKRPILQKFWMVLGCQAKQDVSIYNLAGHAVDACRIRHKYSLRSHCVSYQTNNLPTLENQIQFHPFVELSMNIFRAVFDRDYILFQVDPFVMPEFWVGTGTESGQYGCMSAQVGESGKPDQTFHLSLISFGPKCNWFWPIIFYDDAGPGYNIEGKVKGCFVVARQALVNQQLIASEWIGA